MKIRSYKDLIVWNKGMQLTEESYQLTQQFPKSELFGLTSQIRRAAVSVPSNIAEGHGRKSTLSYIHHLSISRGSLQELETQLLLSIRLRFISRDQSFEAWLLIDEIGKMLNALMKKLKKKWKSKRALTPNP